MDYDQLATIEFNQNDLWWYMEEQPYGVSEQHYPTFTDDEWLTNTNILEFDPCLDQYFSQQPNTDPMLNDSLHECLAANTNILEFDRCLYPQPQQPTLEYFNHFETQWNTNLSIYPSFELDTEPVKDIIHIPNDHDVSSTINVNLMEDRESVSDPRIRMKRQLKNRSKPKSSGLELEEIQKHFHLPITKAAKELRVGVTVLKKRCRELNIARWPHRKIKSLKTLIHNVRELGILRNENEIEMLEEHRRAVEKVPGLHLTAGTKKLRQACFKANYKKRRIGLSTSLPLQYT